MRNIILIFIFSFLTIVQFYGQNSNNFFSTDKLLHMGAGHAIGSTTTFAADQMGSKRPELWGIGSVLVIGVGKEIYDKYSGNGKSETMDVLATLSGGVMAVFVLKMTINNRQKRNNTINLSYGL